MTTARFIASLTTKANKDFNDALADGVYVESEREARIEEWVSDSLRDCERESSEDRDFYGIPEDTPCMQNADLWGTGEGRYHGLIG